MIPDIIVKKEMKDMQKTKTEKFRDKQLNCDDKYLRAYSTNLVKLFGRSSSLYSRYRRSE